MDYETSTGTLLEHCNNLISQTIFSAAFALLKLLNSPFASKVDVEHGKSLFNGSLLGARRMSVQSNDVASRVATRVPQLWRKLGAGAPWSMSKSDPLVLTIQHRMSVSHGYDCMLNWREHLKAENTLAQNGEATTSGLATGVSIVPSSAQIPQPASYQAVGLPADVSSAGLEVGNLDLFSSLDWMLGDYANNTLAPYDFGSQSNPP